MSAPYFFANAAAVAAACQTSNYKLEHKKDFKPAACYRFFHLHKGKNRAKTNK